MMKVYVRSDVGLVRPINEDAYILPEAGECFCAVADGMGGHNAGEVASAMAVESFARCVREAQCLDAPTLDRAVRLANTAVFNASQEDYAYSGMGTTFTALARCGDDVVIAHVGDSRAYLIREGCITQLTTDHTLVEELVAQGLITRPEARSHPRRNIITRALGTSEELDVDMIQRRLQPDDVYFLCTDGLSNHVSEDRLLEIVGDALDWQQKASAAVEAALDDGGLDNITAMFVTFEEVRKT